MTELQSPCIAKYVLRRTCEVPTQSQSISLSQTLIPLFQLRLEQWDRRKAEKYLAFPAHLVVDTLISTRYNWNGHAVKGNSTVNSFA